MIELSSLPDDNFAEEPPAPLGSVLAAAVTSVSGLPNDDASLSTLLTPYSRHAAQRIPTAGGPRGLPLDPAAGGHDVAVLGAGVPLRVVEHAQVVADLVGHDVSGREACRGVRLPLWRRGEVLQVVG